VKHLGKILLSIFVISITLWYLITPYLVRPHPKLKDDLKTLIELSKTSVDLDNDKIENWTKWRMFLSQSSQEKDIVIHSHQTLSINNLSLPVRVGFEWRPEYKRLINRGSHGRLEVSEDVPWYSDSHGIYDHYQVETEDVSGVTVVRFYPNYLFGVSHKIVDNLYPSGPAQFPITGMLTETTAGDRLLVQCYMNLVVLSVIFLLWVNNPPSARS